ncbi:DNA replication factor Cdt1 [Cololabis saira]|uniref:DNA replication factor Cdt1 n=1 Tax=Cololabis saira TaxID=129043 RepID=UPI002AD273CD|nr:DNA replication factor Cdt1 [Cololabis saira]
MSQVRVTDFFSQRKKGASAAGSKPRCRSSAAAPRCLPPGPPRCSSPVHQEFLRVIDEAAGLGDGASVGGKQPLCSPRTPKRSAAEEGCGESVPVSLKRAKSAARAGASRAGTSPVEARHGPRVPRAPARKRLVLPGAKQVLTADDAAALKSRLQKIVKHAAEITSSSSASASSSTPSSAARPEDGARAPASSPDVGTLQRSVAIAKQLAAKVQSRKEAVAAEEDTRTEEVPQKDSVELPAYQRYHTLAQDLPPGLTLPLHYRLLAEMFRSMDNVVAIMYNRSESVTFSKIKQGVQDMTRRRFEENHVGQIKTVFPEAYTLKQEKNATMFSSTVPKNSYQLTVEPVILSAQNEARPVLSASHLLERRRRFNQNLVSIVKQHHTVFLSSLVPPVSVPEDKLTRWHPRFNVDTVPAVGASPLPVAPQGEKLSTAQEVLDKARSLITPKMQKALVGLTMKTEGRAAERPEQAPAAPADPVPSSLKGVSQSLLERVRAKEAQKLQAAMTRNPAQEERLLMMSRLGELARILRNVFVAEKKPALIMELLCNRMVTSYRSALSTGDMEKHVRLLADVAADWLSLHPVRKDCYVKMNRKVELSAVLEQLSRRLREEERR